MLSYYRDDYAPYQTTRIDEKNRERPMRSTLFRLLKQKFGVRDVERIIPPMPIGRMLEIGCASGRFLHSLAQQGWDVEGIEPGAEAARAAQSHGYHIHVGQIETAPEPARRYNLVVAWMVLEHLHEPIAALKKFHRWTEDGAWFAFSVPDASSWEFAIFRDRWYALQVPIHCYHYTPTTLKQVLKAGGWKLEKIFWQGSTGNLVGSLRYLADDHGWKQLSSFLAGMHRRPGLGYPIGLLRRVLQITHACGRMTVWASRIDS
jgi:SAM-dependent methyltransferase